MRKFRQKTIYWLNVSALALLALFILLFIWMWVRAYMQGEIPQSKWSQYDGGNHGPWRRGSFYILGPFTPIYNLRWLWSQALNLQILSFYLGLVSIILKPNRKAAIIMLLTFVSGVVFFTTHYWLVD